MGVGRRLGARSHQELAKGGKHSLGYVSAVSVEQREIELVRRTHNEPLGLRLCQAEGCTGGVIVESVLEGSVAARCGVPVGMVVRTIQSKIAGKLGKVKTAGKLDHAKAAAAVGDVVKLAGNVITFELAHKKVSLGNGGDKVRAPCHARSLAREMPAAVSSLSDARAPSNRQAFGAAYHYVDGKEFHRLLGCTIIQVKQQIVAMRPTEVKDDGRCRDQDDAAPSARSLARSSVAALDRSPRSGTKAGGILRLLLGAMGAGVASVAALNWHRNYDKRIEKAATAA